MRGLRTTLTAATFAAIIVGLATAQPPQGRRGGGQGFGGMGGMMRGGSMFLLANDSVQKELKLTDDQKEKVKAASDKQREKMQEQFKALREGDGPPDREKMQETMKTMTAEAEKTIKDILKADQQKRLKQITLQQAGAAAFSEKEVADALKITDEQKEKIKGINDESQQDMRDIMQEARGNRQEMQQKMSALRKETAEKAQAVLNASQKKQFKEMLGAPFELKQDPNARGGFGKGGRGKGGEKKGDGDNKDRPKRGDGF